MINYQRWYLQHPDVNEAFALSQTQWSICNAPKCVQLINAKSEKPKIWDLNFLRVHLFIDTIER